MFSSLPASEPRRCAAPVEAFGLRFQQEINEPRFGIPRMMSQAGSGCVWGGSGSTWSPFEGKKGKKWRIWCLFADHCVFLTFSSQVKRKDITSRRWWQLKPNSLLHPFSWARAPRSVDAQFKKSMKQTVLSPALQRQGGELGRFASVSCFWRWLWGHALGNGCLILRSGGLMFCGCYRLLVPRAPFLESFSQVAFSIEGPVDQQNGRKFSNIITKHQTRPRDSWRCVFWGGFLVISWLDQTVGCLKQCTYQNLLGLKCRLSDCSKTPGLYWSSQTNGRDFAKHQVLSRSLLSVIACRGLLWITGLHSVQPAGASHPLKGLLFLNAVWWSSRVLNKPKTSLNMTQMTYMTIPKKLHDSHDHPNKANPFLPCALPPPISSSFPWADPHECHHPCPRHGDVIASRVVGKTQIDQKDL